MSKAWETIKIDQDIYGMPRMQYENLLSWATRNGEIDWQLFIQFVKEEGHIIGHDSYVPNEEEIGKIAG